MSPASSTRPAQASASATSATTTRAWPAVAATHAAVSSAAAASRSRAHHRGSLACGEHGGGAPVADRRVGIVGGLRPGADDEDAPAGQPIAHPPNPGTPSSRCTPREFSVNADHVVLPDEHHDLDQLALVVARGELLPGRVADAAVVVELVGGAASSVASKASQPDAAGAGPDALDLLVAQPAARGDEDVLAPLVLGSAPPAGAQDQQLPVAGG